jgi:hypothetical protein
MEEKLRDLNLSMPSWGKEGVPLLILWEGKGEGPLKDVLRVRGPSSVL